jgi:energy-coupling factor transport system permease protein
MFVTTTTPRTGLHRLEPRAKLIALISLVTSVFFLPTLWPLGLLAGMLVVVSVTVGGFGKLGRRLLQATLVGYPFTWLLFWSSYWSSETPLPVGLAASAQDSAVFTLRLLIIVLGNLLLLATTDPRDLARSLRAWWLPAELCVMLMTVLRFVPLAGGQAQRIFDTQRCRGYRLRRLWLPTAWLPLCIPLLVSTLHRAEALAISLELRGFSQGLTTMAAPDRWRWHEYVVAGSLVVGCVVCLVTR